MINRIIVPLMKDVKKYRDCVFRKSRFLCVMCPSYSLYVVLLINDLNNCVDVDGGTHLLSSGY